MTVAELIKLLETAPKNALIAFDDSEWGWDFDCKYVLKTEWDEEGVVITPA